MKLRSLLIALALGCILLLAPIITTYWPAISVWNGLARLAEWQTTHNNQSQQHTAPLAVHPDPEQPLASPQGETALLVMTKWSSPTTVTAGDPLTYTIVVTNTGTATAHKIVITDELPTGVAFRGESTLTVLKGEEPQLQVTERQITGTVSLLQPTGRIIFIGRAIVDPAANRMFLSNTAFVTATNNGNPSHQATVETVLLTPTPTATPSPTAPPTSTPVTTPTLAVTVTATAVAPATPTATPDLADLQIRKSAAPDPVIAGTILTYTLVISNLGPGRAQGIVISDTLPPDLFFDGHSTLSVLRGEQPQLLLSRTQLTGTIALLNVGGLITITTPVRAPIVMVNQMRVNQATVSATTPDPQPANNSAGVPVTFLPAPIMDHKSFLPAITK